MDGGHLAPVTSPLPNPAATDLSVPFNKHGHTDLVTSSLGFPCLSLPLASSFPSGQPYAAAQPRTWVRACFSAFPYSGLGQPTAQRNRNRATTLCALYPRQTSPLPCEVYTWHLHSDLYWTSPTNPGLCHLFHPVAQIKKETTLINPFPHPQHPTINRSSEFPTKIQAGSD